jgi:hypothetical protein
MNLDEQMYNGEARISTIIWDEVWSPLNQHTTICDNNTWHHIWILTQRNIDNIINSITIPILNELGTKSI